MKHITLVADVWELLKEAGMEHLEVAEGNCTGRTMIWIRRPPVALGSPAALAWDELNVLDIIFGELRTRDGKVYSYGVWKAKAAMALGAWRKRLPVCASCGQIFLKNADAVACVHPKMVRER